MILLATVLDLVGTRPESRYVVFEPFANPNQRSDSCSRIVGEYRHWRTLFIRRRCSPIGMNGEDFARRLWRSRLSSGLVVTSAGKTPSIFHESSSQTAGTFSEKAAGLGTEAFEGDLYVPVQVPMMRTLLSAAIARKVQRFTVGKRFGIH
jgi:hypothetical protein